MPTDLNRDPYYDEVWSKYQGICVVCGLPAVTIHEIVPKSKYVGDWRLPENRVPLCHECHSMIHHDGTAKWEETLRRFAVATKFMLDGGISKKRTSR